MARIGIVATARRCRCSPPPPPRRQQLLLFLLVALATKAAAGSFSSSSSSSSATTDPRPTDFIDCNDPCNGGDANYELIASVQTIPMAFGNHTYRGRTFARPDPKTGRVPYGKHTGPTITAKPGQTLWIKFRNELGERTTPTETTTDTATDTTKPPSREGEEEEVQLLPKNVAVEDYWVRLKKPGEKIKYRYYKPPVASPDLMEVDWSNIPSGYDSTNLHLHGLDVEVHMFDPVGTHNPEAPHVKIGPGKCYCYRFRIPEDHPDGLYWYHPHVHGSSAVQLWGGMMGLVKIEGTFVEELRTRHGVTDSRDFVIWDPAFQDVRDLKPGATHDIEVDEFLNGQTTLSKIHPFLVNGEITPLFDNVVAGEVLHLRVLCGTIENENTFIVYKEPEGEQQQRPTDYSTWDWKESGLPFWVVASDGVAYDRARKRTAIVLAGGQREELLLRFDEPGTYVVSQQGIQGMQFFGMYGHPHDQLLAKIRVVEKATDEDEPERGGDHEDESRAGGGALEEAEEAGSTTTTAKREKQRQSRLRLQKYTDETMDAMEFTPGYGPEETIRAESITKTESIVFSMGANRNMAPFPQYYINGKAFRQDRLDFHANPGDAVEYVLINGNHNVHPFHIHVNRFQVKEMGSELSAEEFPALSEVMNFDPDVWRDTVVVPPNGRARIWVQYKNYTGKTVFHCHFLAHEDTGMMATLFIGSPDVLFRWRDHLPLLVGCGVGLVLGVALVALAVVVFRRDDGGGGESSETNHGPIDYYYYSVARMNKAKTRAITAKTLD